MDKSNQPPTSQGMPKYFLYHRLRNIVLPHIENIGRGVVPSCFLEFSNNWSKNSIEGWTCRDPVFMEEGLHLSGERDDTPYYSGEWGYYALDKFFSFTHDNSMLIFSPLKKISFLHRKRYLTNFINSRLAGPSK